jgi:hypothetical protein
MLVVPDDGNQHALKVLRDLGIRSAVHRERITKSLHHVKLPKLNQANVAAFLESMNFDAKHVKRYIKALWTIKYDTVYDLLETDREQLKRLDFRDGHIDAIMLVSDGLHSKFATEHGDD